MKIQIFNFVVLLVTLGLVLLSSAAFADQYNLAPGARGELCLSCHTGFSETMQKKHIHTPLAEGNCTGCHNPHSTDHGKLLAADPTQICATCHDDLVVSGARSAH